MLVLSLDLFASLQLTKGEGRRRKSDLFVSSKSHKDCSLEQFYPRHTQCSVHTHLFFTLVHSATLNVCSHDDGDDGLRSRD